MNTLKGKKNALKPLMFSLVFALTYLITISMPATAQTQGGTPAIGGGITLSDLGHATVSGRVIEADENWVLVNAAGKEIRIYLDDIDLNAESDVVFDKGMSIMAQGEMRGEDFGVAIMRAETIQAAQSSSVTIVP
jgi:hypothetical protein